MRIKRFISILVCMMLCVCMLISMPISVFADDERIPTRTTELTITPDDTEMDYLTDEGWKWIPNADGGTLTLQNAYIKTSGGENPPNNRKFSAIRFKGFDDSDNITIHLIGDNYLETENTDSTWLISIDANVIITAEEGASLDFKVPEVNYYSFLYCIFADSLTLQSGDITSNTDFSFTDYSVNIEGGSLDVDAGYIEDSYVIYSGGGDVNISGGSVDIETGGTGIYIAGNGMFAESSQTVKITGGDVDISASDSEDTWGTSAICARHVYIDTDETVEIYGDECGIYIYDSDKMGNYGSINILNVGDGSFIKNSEESEKDFIYNLEYVTITKNIASADYIAVNEAKAKADSLNPDYYVDFSEVTSAVNAVVEGKNILEQSEVDAMAAAINKAIDELEIKNYSITANVNETTGGSVEVSKTSAPQGTEVTLTLNESEGYHFASWTVSPSTVNITENADGTWKFVVPYGNVTVTANFEKCYGEVYNFDETNHWNQCVCGEIINEEAHTYVWVVDKEATAEEAGSRHEQCSVCGYAKVSVEIPATGSESQNPNTENSDTGSTTEAGVTSETSDTTAPKTGDNTNVILWMAILVVSVAGLLCTYIVSENKKYNR